MATTLNQCNQVILNSGSAVDARASDLELGMKAIVGYHNYFQIGISEARELVQKRLDNAGLNWRAVCPIDRRAPERSIRVGQVRVHHGDMAFPLYVVPRG